MLVVLLFLVYGVGQGLVQPSLINTVVGSSGVSGEDALRSAAGLFLTTAQSSIALGVAAIGRRPSPGSVRRQTPRAISRAALTALSCNLILQIATSCLCSGFRARGDR